MTKFEVSLQIGFYSTPYQYWTVWARNKEEALAKVGTMLPEYADHRFLNVKAV